MSAQSDELFKQVARAALAVAPTDWIGAQNRQLAEGIRKSYRGERSECCGAPFRLNRTNQWECSKCGRRERNRR